MSDTAATPPGAPSAATPELPKPVDGNFVFQVASGIRVRYNADGWVEEIGRGGADDPLGTKLSGKPATKLDDTIARRYYDLYARIVLFDINSKQSRTDKGSASAHMMFKDLEPGSPMYDRVNLLIDIGNHYFQLGVKRLG